MDTIPVNPALTFVLMGVSPKLRNGEPAVNSEGEPLSVVSAALPPEGKRRSQTLDVTVPARSIAKDLPPFGQIRFENLIARAWETDGRHGIALSAEAVRAATKVTP